jgi:hypothetical protein
MIYTTAATASRQLEPYGERAGAMGLGMTYSCHT